LALSGVCANSAGARGHNSLPCCHVQHGQRVGHHLARLTLRHVLAKAQPCDQSRIAFDHAAWQRILSIAACLGLERIPA
jgi:hypothetical protein